MGYRVQGDWVINTSTGKRSYFPDDSDHYKPDPPWVIEQRERREKDRELRIQEREQEERKKRRKAGIKSIVTFVLGIPVVIGMIGLIVATFWFLNWLGSGQSI